jgi:hypothetical protein
MTESGDRFGGRPDTIRSEGNEVVEMYEMKRSLPLLLVVGLCALGCGKDNQPAKDDPGTQEPFSFFVTSLKAMRQLSGSEDGFGGDLRFGETGDGAGLRGADKICTTIAEQSMPGNSKVWRAFLSATQGEDGEPVDAITRIGDGPWYDRVGRLIATDLADLAQERPAGADPAIVDDLPNEDGVPNHRPELTASEVDNHDVLTGTNEAGKLFSSDAGTTCNDWTSAVGEVGPPRCGHSWPRRGGPNDGPNGGPGGGPGGPGGMMFNGGGGEGGGGFSVDFHPGGAGPIGIAGAPPMSTGDGPAQGSNGSGNNWMSALDESGCAPGAFIIEAGPPGANGTKTVGDGGGYGAIYCFALTP